MDIENYTVDDVICDESFQHYCLGNNKEDVLFWENIIEKHPDKTPLINEAALIFSILNGKQGNIKSHSNQLQDAIQRLDRIKNTVADELKERTSPEPEVIKRKNSWIKYASAIAASILLITFSFQFLLKKDVTEKLTVEVVIKNTVFSNLNKLRKTVLLNDGTVIILHNNSSITIAPDFSPKKRELTLSGEAFFDVTHDPLHPFLVHTAKINIEVLGTIFNVRAYEGESKTETTLLKGKVVVSLKDSPGEKVILQPNEKMIFNDNELKGSSVKHKESFTLGAISVDPVNQKAKEIEWVQSQLKIDDEPLAAIASKLQKWYGIEINFSDEEVKSYRYSGTFESETVIQALEALQLSFPFQFKVENDKIIISK